MNGKILRLLITTVFLLEIFLCKPVLGNETEKNVSPKNFTNLVVFMKFSDEDEFINNIYAGNDVCSILDNTYNKSVYSAADYFETVSGGKMKMQTLFLFDGDGSLTLSKPRGYYAEKDEQNPYGYEGWEENSRMYELRADWANAVSSAFASGNKPKDINGKQYKISNLDLNKDEKIDLITIIYKYTEQNISINWNSPLWDYNFYSDLISVSDNDKTYRSGEYVQLT